jgi:hypothetical protein
MEYLIAFGLYILFVLGMMLIVLFIGMLVDPEQEVCGGLNTEQIAWLVISGFTFGYPLMLGFANEIVGKF